MTIPGGEDAGGGVRLAVPIVIDFDGDGEGLVELDASATRFDMNGDGVADRTGWIEAGDALLAIDRNANGLIDDINEIAFVHDHPGANTDMQGLAGFDANGDGVIDAADERFVEFRLWFDRNANGETDAGELLSLVQAGVVRIDLAATQDAATPEPGSNIVYRRGTVATADGGTRTLLDAGLAYQAARAVEFTSLAWDGGRARYRIAAANGALHVTARNPGDSLKGPGDALAPAALLSFGKHRLGMLTAILVDVDGDGLEALRRDRTRAAFDMDGDGTRDDTGWMSGGDGLLVIDRDGDGLITAPAELSFLAEKADARSAWDALAALDQNRDGTLDTGDARFGELRVWVDRDGDGRTDAGELRTLASVGIASIGLAASPADASASAGSNLPLSVASFTRADGGVGTLATVAFGFRPSDSGTAAPGISNDALQAGSISQAAARLAEALAGYDSGSASDAWSLPEQPQRASIDLAGASTAG